MITDCLYRKAMTYQQAVDELIKYKGTQFDPKLVDELMTVSNNRDKI